MAKSRLARLATAGLAALTIVATTGPSFAVNDEQTSTFMIPDPDRTSDKAIAVVFDDNQTNLGPVSYLADKDTMYPNWRNGKWEFQDTTFVSCLSVSDQKCSGTKVFESDGIMTPCLSPSDDYCIESIYARSEDGKKIAGSFSRFFPESSPLDFKGDPNLGIGNGKTPSIWSIPGVNNSAGKDTYMPIFKIRYDWDKTKGESKFSITQLTAALFAIDLQKQSGLSLSYRGVEQGLDAIKHQGCAVNTDTECAFRVSFPPSTRFGATLRFGQPPQYWFYGRLYKPDISIAPRAGSAITLDVEANPVIVPIFAGRKPYKDLPKTLQDFYKNGSYSQTGSSGMNGAGPDPNQWNLVHWPRSEDMDVFKNWLPALNDRAAAMTTEWFFRSAPGNSLGNNAKCYSKDNQVNGFVTSNATVYTPGPPNYNQSEGTLDYTVAAPHFTAANNVMRGTYDLQMRADVARCIYGYSKAPISAEIQVTSADGTAQVATKNVTERNGWLLIGAYNFEFSAPTLKVKITQAGAGSSSNSGNTANNSTNNSSGVPSKQPIPLKNIKCVKGKAFLLIPAKSCPKGYTLAKK